MYRKTRLHLALVALAVGLFMATGEAQDNKEAGKGKRTLSPSGKAVARLHAAYELAAHGREKKMPEVLIAAASVIGTTDMDKGEAKKAEVQKEATVDARQEAESLLQEAVKLAKDADNSDTIQKLAADVRKNIVELKRGPVDGRPRVYRGYFNSPADPDDSYFVDLRGGELTSVSLISHTGTDLDLEIYDRQGSLITRQGGAQPNEYYCWYVPFNSEYRIRVINYKPGAFSQYTLTISR